MLNSIFVHAPDAERLRTLRGGVTPRDGLPCLAMDTMLTLDFVVLCTLADVYWFQGPPLVLDELAGLHIAHINPAGLERVVGMTGYVSARQQGDLERLARFVVMHGTENVYECTTF